jgi:hypothetical protein
MALGLQKMFNAKQKNQRKLKGTSLLVLKTCAIVLSKQKWAAMGRLKHNLSIKNMELLKGSQLQK